MFPLDGHISTTIHFAALGGLSLYGMHRLWLLLCWHQENRKGSPADIPSCPSDRTGRELPIVTVQLPLYNERFIVERLLNAAAGLDWPRERLEIQILDDSKDDTCKIVDERAAHWRKKGIDMKVFRRGNREGYKAGALNNGMKQARGEYIAIFDADFLPRPGFLRRTLPFFSDEKTGMVQARWGFLNADHSWLTGIQALLLGPHFSIEHWVRHRRRLFFNFNGTAGVWRRKAIESSGGWQWDTVTEDLDLSYRAQLAGWRFIYLDNVAVPSELPVTMASFRNQQQRWAKGSIQTAKKILPRLFLSSVPAAVKLESLAHLLANFGWLLGSIVTLTLYPAITERVGIGPYQLMRLDMPLFISTSLAIFLYFLFYKSKQKGCASFMSLLLLPVLSIGMAPSIALSVLIGVFSRGGVFKRTPKFGISAGEKLPGLAFLYRQRSFLYLFVNTIFLAYCILPIIFACRRHTWVALPFLAIFPIGFLLVILKDLRELRT